MIHRIGAHHALSSPRLRDGEFMPEPVREAGDDLVLHVEEIGDQLIEALSPEMRAGLGLNQLDIDAHTISRSLDTAFEHIAHVEFASDLLEINRLALVCEGCAAPDDERAGYAREVGRQALGHAIDEIVLLRIVTDIGKG